MIHVLLPVHNRREVTARFIGCLVHQTLQDYQLILVDDGSSDGTADMVRAAVPNVQLLRGEGHWWWAGCLQHGFRWLASHGAADADIVLIVNDDTEFGPDFIETGARLIDANPGTMFLAEGYCRRTGNLVDRGTRINWSRLRFEPAQCPSDVQCLATRGLFFRYGDLRRIGGFHPKLLPHYLSDYEFTIRATSKGIRLATDPGLRLTLDPETTGYHSVRNESFAGFLRDYFSPKSARNPISWTFFVFIACPWRWKLLSLARVWGGTVRQIGRRLFRGVVTQP